MIFHRSIRIWRGTLLWRPIHGCCVVTSTCGSAGFSPNPNTIGPARFQPTVLCSSSSFASVSLVGSISRGFGISRSSSQPLSLASSFSSFQPVSTFVSLVYTSPRAKHSPSWAAQLGLPLLIKSAMLPPWDLQTGSGPMKLNTILCPCSKDLTPAELAIAFSLYRDTICTLFLKRLPELDDYLSIVLDMALWFGGTGFFQYLTWFSSQAAGHVAQYNQGMYWGIRSIPISLQPKLLYHAVYVVLPPTQLLHAPR